MFCVPFQAEWALFAWIDFVCVAADPRARDAFQLSNGLRCDSVLLLIGMFGCCTISVLYPALLTFRADFRSIHDHDTKGVHTAGAAHQSVVFSAVKHSTDSAVKLLPSSPTAATRNGLMSGGGESPHFSRMRSMNSMQAMALSPASPSAGAVPAITFDQVLNCPAALLLFRQFCIEHFGECTCFFLAGCFCCG
jgi:hypothetical protein